MIPQIQEAFDELAKNTHPIDFVRKEYSECHDESIKSAATSMILLFDSSLATSRIVLTNSISEDYIVLRLTEMWEKDEFFTLRTLLMKFIVVKHLRGVKCTEAIRRLYGRSSSLLDDLREVVGKPNIGLKSILDELFSSGGRISSNRFGSSQLNGVTISSKSNRFGSSQLNGATWVQLPPVVREEDGTVRPIMVTDHPMALYHQLLFNNMS